MANIKDKDRILKAARKKLQIMYKRTLIRNFADQKEMEWYIYRDESKIPTVKHTLLSKAIIQIWRRDKEFYRQAKAKSAQQH